MVSIGGKEEEERRPRTAGLNRAKAQARPLPERMDQPPSGTPDGVGVFKLAKINSHNTGIHVSPALDASGT